MARKIWMATIAGLALMGSNAAMAAEGDVGSAASKGSSFYQKVDEASCSGGTCTATFSKVPAGKVLETTNLSCTAKATSIQAIPAFATLQAGSTILTYMTLIPFSSGNAVIAAGSQGGAVFIDKGKTPSVTITDVSAATCTLSGRLTGG